MFSIELVEGKDKPTDRGVPKFEGRFGKTGGLLLRMLKDYFNTGRYVVLDSGFCVLQAIIGLYNKGLFLFAGALIKKRKFWPKYIPGDAIDARFAPLATGQVGALNGLLNNTRYFVWGMKEPNYVMKIMATGGTLESDDSCKVAYRGNGPDSMFFQVRQAI